MTAEIVHYTEIPDVKGKVLHMMPYLTKTVYDDYLSNGHEDSYFGLLQEMLADIEELALTEKLSSSKG